jgi:hypothetical protein
MVVLVLAVATVNLEAVGVLVYLFNQPSRLITQTEFLEAVAVAAAQLFNTKARA